MLEEKAGTPDKAAVPEGPLQVEVLSSTEVLTCLWNKNATEKCRIGLTDTVIYENGLPARYYVTGKTGEITKKRAVDLSAITQRWMKIGRQNESPMLAIMRQEGGVLKFMDDSAWMNYIQNDVRDPSIISTHCFIKGSNQTFFRNTFSLRDRLGRFISSTYSYAYKLDKDPRDPTKAASVSVLNDSETTFTENRASSLKNIMDLATSTVTRYLENMLGLRVLSISVDYVIDTKSQLWMLWTSDCRFVRTTDLANANISGLAFGEDRLGRMQWAGLKYREGVRDGTEKRGSRSPSPNRQKRSTSPSRSNRQTKSKSPGRQNRQSSPLRGTTPTYDSRERSYERPLRGLHADPDAFRLYEAEKLPLDKATAQLSATSYIIEDAVLHSTAKIGTRREDLANAFSVVHSNSKLKESTFPDAFKCKGDYCAVRIKATGPLHPGKETREHMYEHFFSEAELGVLRKDKNFSKIMDFAADGPGLAAINMRSILLAREERGGAAPKARGADGTSWQEYPITPRERPGGTINLGTLHSSARGNDGVGDPSEETKRDAERQQQLSKDKEHRETFTKQVAGYYDQVRVCGVCNNVYCMLDWARGLLGRGDAHGAWKEAPAGVAGTASSPKARKRKGAKGGQGEAALSTGLNSSSLISNISDDVYGSTIDLEASVSSIDSKALRGKDKNRRTWRDYEGKKESEKMLKNLPQGASVKKAERTQFADLDDYLRDGADTLAARKARERELFVKKRVEQMRVAEGSDNFEGSNGDLVSNREANVYRGTVQIVFEANHPHTDYALEAKAMLEEAYFDVHWSKDGRQAVNDYMNRESGFDCLLVQRDCALSDAFEVTKAVREAERLERKKAAAAAAAEGIGRQPTTKRHAVICYTSQTSPNDLKEYMRADMDGCVSFPVNKASLLNTVRAAIPQHLAVIKPPEPPRPPEGSKVYKLGAFGELEGADDSATMAAKTLPVSQKLDEDFAFNGVVQIDADTRLPYIILDAARSAKVILNPDKPYFNLIVCHDMFDTAERMKIFLRPIVQKYLGMQVLLWNQAGQAFTEWREEQLLNNEYQAMCLNEVIGQLGEKGTKDFDTTRPFYMLGYGNGSSIAGFYASHYRVPNLRGFISINGHTFVDSFLAGAMHDCINIFQCTPPARPDLPVYFFSRFLFSKDYLAKVSVPLALNLYTAVYNPITLAGRINLCRGVLQSVDLRSLLKEIDCPVICVHSTQDNLCRPLHTEPYVTGRAGEVRSIYKVLKEPAKTCVVWMKGGHEVFQENRKQVQLLLEQILTGFHESHDISYPPAAIVDKSMADQGTFISKLPWEGNKNSTVEDKYVDSVLGNMSKLAGGGGGGGGGDSSPGGRSIGSESLRTSSLVNDGPASPKGRSVSPVGGGNRGGRNDKVFFASNDPNAWTDYSQSIAESSVIGRKKEKDKTKKDSKTVSASVSLASMDPTSASFEKQDSIYRKQTQNINDYPEVKEYMGWRLKRNKKRLQRLQAAARTLQSAFRSFMARQMVKGIRRRKAASIIQRAYRGWLGRVTFLDQARRIWGAQLIQRAFRGYQGRKFFWYLRLRLASAAQIQRVFRGYRARKFVSVVKKVRYKAASLIQALFRRDQARRAVFKKRLMRNCCVTLQRVYRGHLGRRRAFAERDKFIFSRSQSHGIEFGRQMLLEHKLHATKLQSDVTLLTQEKVGAEEQVEALLEEISSFEEGVHVLEKEMHQLAKVEAQAAAYMDEESKAELREQKIKLDKEFGEMLGKIGNRKDMLNDLERKLASIDKARQVKEEELRTLERKLVVLLEEQQNELNAIKRKQDVRGAMLAASHSEIMKATSGAPGAQTALVVAGSGGGGGGGGSGPSIQEKRQAAQLMQSTETLMKFGFMSMSMTYFSSLNMIKALRTVSAQDTVMAALADIHAQRGQGTGVQEGPTPAGIQVNRSAGQYTPGLKKGQLSGQEDLRVSSWSVDDVAKWLHSLSLGQYSETFVDAAIDGEFLYDINDDDLKNTLGIEHRLHRKKILNCVHRLKIAEAQKNERLNAILRSSGSMDAPSLLDDETAQQDFPANPFKPNEGVPGEDSGSKDGPKIPHAELMSLTRHSKISIIKEALDYLPNKKFDSTVIKIQYVGDHGTIYVEGYEKLPWHVNKTDEHGNTMLSLACQNGNTKICKYLISKGANPNHQNKQGQSPPHFAIAYKFFELSQWLFEQGARDDLENKAGLTCYDGLSGEDGDG